MDAKDRMDIENAPEWKKNLARLGTKVSMGEEQKPGWSGKLPFYLFYCPSCETLQKDYPHSWPESQYLWCDDCKIKINFIQLRTQFKMLFWSAGFVTRLLTLRLFSKLPK